MNAMQCLRRGAVLVATKRKVLLSAVVTANHNRQFGCELLPDLTMAEVKKKLDDRKFVKLDCRTPEEFNNEGHVPGFVNIELKPLGSIFMLPDDQFTEKTGIKRPAKDDEIIIMCLGGIRARTGQLALKGYGYTNVRNYVGSFTEWRDNNEEIVYPNKK